MRTRLTIKLTPAQAMAFEARAVLCGTTTEELLGRFAADCGGVFCTSGSDEREMAETYMHRAYGMHHYGTQPEDRAIRHRAFDIMERARELARGEENAANARSHARAAVGISTAQQLGAAGLTAGA